MPAPELSVVIPVLNEARAVGALLGDLAGLAVSREVIVVDGGSGDETVSIAERAGATVIRSERGRGRQLAAGARSASAPVLCFLHADVRLDFRALAAIDRIVRAGAPSPAAFRLHIDGPGAAFRLIEHTANTRSRWLGLPYGDQGLTVSRAHYNAAGGYANVPLFEDVGLVRALARISPVILLDESLSVSPRRWERDGALWTTLRNVRLLAAYARGVPAEELVRRYESTRSRKE